MQFWENQIEANFGNWKKTKILKFFEKVSVIGRGSDPKKVGFWI
jgi:hypothetical protein